MSGATRNQAYGALFDLTAPLDGAVGGPFVSRSRKLRHFAKITAEEQPVFFQAEHLENAAEVRRGLPTRVWRPQWVVFFRSDPEDQSDVGQAMLGDIKDFFETVMFGPGPDDVQNLGGLVERVYIDGYPVNVPGDDDGQGLLVVQLAIIVPGGAYSTVGGALDFSDKFNSGLQPSR